MIPASSSWQQLASQPGAMQSSPLTVLFSIAGYTRAFTNYHTGAANQYPWLVKGKMGKLSQRLQELEGSSSTSNISITVLDYQRLVTADLAATNLIGKTATIQVGFPSLPESQWVTLATMIVDTIDYDDQNTSYTFVLRDNSLLINNYAFLYGDDGMPTNNNNPATLLGAPLTLLQNALEQAGLPAGQINSTAISNLNSNAYYGVNFEFKITYPPQAKQFAEQEILKPLGGYWFWNYLGQFTVASMLPYAPPASAMTLDQTLIAGKIPTPKQSGDYTSAVSFRMDGDSNGQNFQTIMTDIYAPAANLYGISQTRVIQARGVRSALGGMRIAHLTAMNLFKRYGLKPFTLRITVLAPALLLELGDKVILNHPLIPNRVTGQMGVSGMLWEVTGRQVDLEKGTVDLDLLDVSWQLSANAWQIAPDGTPSYASASTSQRAQYMFVSSGGKYSNGDQGHTIY